MKMTQQEGLQNKSRRDMLAGAAAVAATLAAGTAFAASDKAPVSHHHHGMNKNTAIIDAALDCVKKGQACNDHCINLVKAGDTSIAACMDTVTEMLAMCTALSQMASSQSRHLTALTKVCIAVCEDCEKECRKHENKHAECKACAESCHACIEACKKVAA